MKAFLSALPRQEESMYIRWWWKQVKWVPVDKASLTQSCRKKVSNMKAKSFAEKTLTHETGVVK